MAKTIQTRNVPRPYRTLKARATKAGMTPLSDYLLPEMEQVAAKVTILRMCDADEPCDPG